MTKIKKKATKYSRVKHFILGPSMWNWIKPLDQLLISLSEIIGLVTFVNSPCNTNQAVNRDVQSQMIYVHRQALFLDTSANKARHWNELKALNEYNFTNINKPGEEPTNAEGKSAPIKYEKCLFDFNESADVIEYWRKLLHVSMHTFKFNVQSYLHENKRIRQDHLNKILSKSDLSNVADLWPIEEFGDHMGPGGTYFKKRRIIFNSSVFFYVFVNSGIENLIEP